jgi:hypothetical protein
LAVVVPGAAGPRGVHRTLTVAESDAGCEKMLCKKPFMRDMTINKKQTLLNPDARVAALPVPCGQCFECRINKSREWLARILAEQRFHSESCFVTLTYAPEHLPDPPFVLKSHIQTFLKSLRNRISKKFRYFAVGEYGDNFGRPHYHVIFFGLGVDYAGEIYTAWGKGEPQSFDCGPLNIKCARYAVGYCVKKLTNEGHEKLYGRAPEFMISSRRRGGIGYPFIECLACDLASKKYFIPEREKVIRECFIGRQKLPLGRYLTGELCKLLDMDVNLAMETYDKQEEDFFHHGIGQSNYYANVVEREAAKRKRNEERRKLRSTPVRPL